MRENRQFFGIMDAELERILKTAEPTYIFSFDVKRHLQIYRIYANGVKLYFMQSNLPHASRCFYISDDFARVLGFATAQRLRHVLNIRKARKFIGVDALRRRINDYCLRSMDLEPLPEYVVKRARKRRK